MTRTLTLALVASATALTSACAQERVDTASKEAIEQIVYDYILENPEIVEEALYKLYDQREADKRNAIAELVRENSDDFYLIEHNNVIGPVDAPVTVVEFFDYHCPPCKGSAGWVMELPETFDNKVRVIFKEWPFQTVWSEQAALAAYAAGKQDKYGEMHLELMKTTAADGFTSERIDEVAEKIGLDVTLMRADMKSLDVQKALANSKALGRNVGVGGTPTFFVDDQPTEDFARETIESMIAARLAEIG